MKKVSINGVGVLKITEKEKSTVLFCKKTVNTRTREGNWEDKENLLNIVFAGEKKDLPAKMKLKAGANINVSGTISSQRSESGKDYITIFPDEVQYGGWSNSPMFISVLDGFVSQSDEKTLGIGVQGRNENDIEWFSLLNVSSPEKYKKGQKVALSGLLILDEGSDGRVYKKILVLSIAFGSAPRKKEGESSKPATSSKAASVKEKKEAPKKEEPKKKTPVPVDPEDDYDDEDMEIPF